MVLETSEPLTGGGGVPHSSETRTHYYKMHQVLAIYELLSRILFNLTKPRELLRATLVSRMFSAVALRILWQNYQCNLGPLLRCVPRRSAIAIVGSNIFHGSLLTSNIRNPPSLPRSLSTS